MEDTGQLAYPWVSSLVDVCLNYNGLSTGKVSLDNILDTFMLTSTLLVKYCIVGVLRSHKLIIVV